jgi:kynurenine formamidase
MKLVDLTLTIPNREREKRSLKGAWYERRTVKEAAWKFPGYTAMIYYLSHWGMAGTYVDFPGHIKETDDGSDADNYPLDRLYRVSAGVIHLDRADGSGKISARELRAHSRTRTRGGALIVNALGQRRFDQIAERSVYLGKDAVQWIISTGVHILVSDVYESNTDPQNVFPDLFAAGILTVCLPVNLHLLTAARVRLSVLPLRFAAVTQLPCRAVAEW